MHEQESAPVHLLPQSQRVHARWGERPALLTPAAFQLRLEEEMRRHARYLTGAAIIRIGVEGGLAAASPPLAEAVATESRGTDAAAELYDGSFCILLVHVDEASAHRVATRFVEVASELAGDEDASTRYVVAVASTRGRRLSAEELWDESERDFWPKRRRAPRLNPLDETSN